MNGLAKNRIEKWGSKAQTTLFIIFAIIMFLLIIFAYLAMTSKIIFNSPLPVYSVQSEKADVQKYVESCLDNVAIPGIYLLAANGGFIYSYNHVLVTDTKKIAYHIFNGTDNAPSTEYMQDELGRFVSESLPICISDLNETDRYDLAFGSPNSTVLIGENEVFVTVNYPVTLNISGTITQFSDFQRQYKIRLGYITDVKQEVLRKYGTSRYVDMTDLASYNVTIKILPYDKNNLVYTFSDNESRLANATFRLNVAINNNLGNTVKTS